MKTIGVIIKKELKAYFNSPIAYIFITIFLVLTGWLFFRSFFIVNQANLRDFFIVMPYVFLFLVPAITMRLFAEEKKQKTIEILMSWPLKEYEIVLGKFLASLIFLIIALVLTLPIPIIVNSLGSPDWGIIIGSYLGTIFLGATYLAVGLAISSLTKNQIIAFILAVVIIFVLFIVGESFVLIAMPSWLAPIFRFVGLGSHFNNIGRGVIDSRDIIYYLSMIGLFLYLNIRFLKWKK